MKKRNERNIYFLSAWLLSIGPGAMFIPADVVTPQPPCLVYSSHFYAIVPHCYRSIVHIPPVAALWLFVSYQFWAPLGHCILLLKLTILDIDFCVAGAFALYYFHSMVCKSVLVLMLHSSE